ncbi:MAG TPA: acyl-CoA dehydrogenase, partial [Gammaproteobacteria bacterium]|nr:acyl-CoA dehydrogenase [Gammaproteobacteria bacterium]
AFLTPICKAFMTDTGLEATLLGQQVFGGHGFIREWGQEQQVRDCRIAPIYEGTNGIQALDFVGRKLPMGGGRAVKALLTELSGMLTSITEPQVQQPLQKALAQLQDALGWLTQHGLQDREQAAAAATPLLKLFGIAVQGFLLARNAQVAEDLMANGDERPVLRSKSKTRDVYLREILPEMQALTQTIKAGKDHLMAFSAEEF